MFLVQRRGEHLELNFPMSFSMLTRCFLFQCVCTDIPPPPQSIPPTTAQDLWKSASGCWYRCLRRPYFSLSHIHPDTLNLFLPIWFLSLHLVVSHMCLCCRERSLCRPDTRQWHFWINTSVRTHYKWIKSGSKNFYIITKQIYSF